MLNIPVRVYYETNRALTKIENEKRQEMKSVNNKYATQPEFITMENNILEEIETSTVIRLFFRIG